MRTLLKLALIAALVAGVAYNAEDIKRYLKIRQM